MMVAAQSFRAAAGFVHRRAAEFAAPDDQRIVQHAALLEVFDQRRDGRSICWHFFGRPFDDVGRLAPVPWKSQPQSNSCT